MPYCVRKFVNIVQTIAKRIIMNIAKIAQRLAKHVQMRVEKLQRKYLCKNISYLKIVLYGIYQSDLQLVLIQLLLGKAFAEADDLLAHKLK